MVNSDDNTKWLLAYAILNCLHTCLQNYNVPGSCIEDVAQRILTVETNVVSNSDWIICHIVHRSSRWSPWNIGLPDYTLQDKLVSKKSIFLSNFNLLHDFLVSFNSSMNIIFNLKKAHFCVDISVCVYISVINFCIVML